MNILKDYKNDLKFNTEYKTSGYYKKSYILKCYDEKNEQTHIYFSIYYSHCSYELYIEGKRIEKIENGTVETFTNNKGMKLIMPYTSYHYSKKQFETTEKFLRDNLYYLLTSYCNMNKNIYID